jgi:hypothetical protein
MSDDEARIDEIRRLFEQVGYVMLGPLNPGKDAEAKAHIGWIAPYARATNLTGVAAAGHGRTPREAAEDAWAQLLTRRRAVGSGRVAVTGGATGGSLLPTVATRCTASLLRCFSASIWQARSISCTAATIRLASVPTICVPAPTRRTCETDKPSTAMVEVRRGSD